MVSYGFHNDAVCIQPQQKWNTSPSHHKFLEFSKKKTKKPYMYINLQLFI